jgi:thiamine-monophosphate kinase
LIRLPGLDRLLVLTADAIVEEIELGLYADPDLVGWMTVTASASDLAAVGADPVGVLLIESLPECLGEAAIVSLQDGIGAACEAYALPVLGGDTNTSASWQMAAVAVGLVPDGVAMTRCGARPGDALCTTGPLGAGAAFAAARLLGQPPSFAFRPTARLDAGRLLRGRASSCIDTSDGALAALDQLMRLNGVGFRLDAPDRTLHPSARGTAEALGVPPWMMLAGLHGEFELLFCLPDEALSVLRHEAARSGWEPLRIGTVTDVPRIEIATPQGTLALDTGAIRNLFATPLPPLDTLIRQIHARAQPIR